MSKERSTVSKKLRPFANPTLHSVIIIEEIASKPLQKFVGCATTKPSI
uniref:Uncharacterized protein n=1 Tax=Picea sitchensis TaxID=3332 RepID=A9NM53_PICSI|nr:unknown [Picea sitchensis]